MAHQPIPAPTPAGTQFTSPVSIIGPQYCTSYPVDLAIVKKVLTITDGNFVVTDINGNVIFKVKGTLLTRHDRRTLLDAAGNPILTLREKVLLLFFVFIIISLVIQLLTCFVLIGG